MPEQGGTAERQLSPAARNGLLSVWNLDLRQTKYVAAAGGGAGSDALSTPTGIEDRWTPCWVSVTERSGKNRILAAP